MLLKTFEISSQAGSNSDGIVSISRAPKYLYGSRMPDFWAAFYLLIVFKSSCGSYQSQSEELLKLLLLSDETSSFEASFLSVLLPYFVIGPFAKI